MPEPSPPDSLPTGGGLNSGAASASLKNMATASTAHLLEYHYDRAILFCLGQDFRRVIGMASMMVLPYQADKLIRWTRGRQAISVIREAYHVDKVFTYTVSLIRL